MTIVRVKTIQTISNNNRVHLSFESVNHMLLLLYCI